MAKKHDELSAAIAAGDELAEDQAALEREPLSAGEALADARALAPDELKAKLPAPVPGDPDYNWAQHYPEGAELYVHTFPDGKTVALKTFGSIYSKTWLYKISRLQTDTDVIFAAIKRGCCPQADAFLMALDDSVGDPLDDLYQAWLNDEGIDSGE
ncbi:hypothetical protein FZI85_25165 [Mycobacterium sp. CBMA293]|uniref:hypothetical protein n=1 Tax=unclassified Mycolicibacterium TaxID=2636767 RepID=UPI0012DC896F|nr:MULTISPECIES: hypothetical protein [unclassified Mycolicibacterium]MUL47608.1 hypothetical protein [Mycolicibacterium sp. CBMA 360]MUL61874.1 hypothetical protein [Mycolicibacterium sp. CBMA 335]MUL68947.1 hypothetical protein [Mycolicibacterium sp. CBMA 311]MUL92836.1 hypothetical protein [Mycolicibacterium sp. CBMA 230]MUM08722.1 hypothetical protein [Mycolicibacterium sp. CBMA 213]